MTTSESLLHRPHDEAPARASLRAGASDRPGSWAGLSAHAFEFVSRGDFVNGVLHQQPGGSAAPLILVLHGTGSAAESSALDFAADWVRAGFSVARIDLPLHGRRASPKLSDRLVAGYRSLVSNQPLDADTRALVEEFARQSISDISRAAQALGELDNVDASRIALVGIGVGGTAALWAANHISGLRGCAVAGGAGRFADSALDPISEFDAASQQNVSSLIVAPSGESEIPATSQTAFFDALPEPKRRVDVGAPDHNDGLASDAVNAIGDFLKETLT